MPAAYEGGAAMKDRMRTLFLSGYWRYTLCFSAIVLTLILAMGIYLYRYYYRTIYSDFLSDNQKYLASVASQHEKGVELIKNVSIQLGDSDDTVPFKLQEQPMKTFSLKDQLKTCRLVSQFYDSLFFMFHGDDYLYTDSTSVQFERFLSTGLVPSGCSPGRLRELLANPGKLSVLREQPVSGFLSGVSGGVLYALPVNPGNKGTLLFLVGSSYYDALLSSPPSELRATYILKDGSVVVKRGEASFTDREIEKTVSGRGLGHFEADGEKGRYLVSVANGDNGFRYCTVQSLEIFRRKILSEQWGLLFFLMLLTIPSTVAIMVLSRKLHRPIRMLRGMFRRDSVGDDLDVIRNGIRELVGHNQELTEIVEKSLSIRRSELIRNFIRGAFDSHEALVEAGEKVGLSLDRKFFAVALADAHSLNERPLTEELLKMFGPGEPVTGHGFNLIDNNQTLFVFFADEPEAISEFASRFAMMGKNLGDSFVMAVSGTHDDYAEVSSAYLEASTAFDSRFLEGESDILSFSGLPSGESVGQFPQAYIESLKNVLRLGDEQSVNEVIKQIFQYLRSSKQSLFVFRVAYNEIIDVLIREWRPGALGIREIYDVFSLSHCLSIQDLDDMLRSVCKVILRNQPHVEEDVHGKMREAAAYMQEHYGDSELNMNALADHLAISAVTLSIEFKKSMGMNPSEYLTVLRINRAKELLLKTSLSIKEISGAVGYYDVPGFIRRFKRYTAQTPLQFRQSGMGLKTDGPAARENS